MKCRFCSSDVNAVFIDLNGSPPSNSFLEPHQLNEPEVYYPLKVFICGNCFLVQVDEYKKSDSIFDSKYVYFSSYSTSWLRHASNYVELMTNRFKLGKESLVIEIASNDGYLLQYFKQRNVPVLGVEPTSNTAEVAKSKGIDSIVDFFGVRLATSLKAKGMQADLLLGNNVLAHVPDINDFVGGMKLALKDGGVITMEFPHLMQLVENNQFDTIYHEHFSYLSFTTVVKVFRKHGFEMFDVDEIPTHGGSLRIYAKHAGDKSREVSDNVAKLLEKEAQRGMNRLDYYSAFQERALKVKVDFIQFLIDQKRKGRKVAGYGAAAKGNTLLNFCGITSDLIDFVVDANPHKQNKLLPGSHIKVVDEQYLKQAKPDSVIIFPWNIKDEIIEQLHYIRGWNGKFVVPIPTLQIF